MVIVKNFKLEMQADFDTAKVISADIHCCQTCNRDLVPFGYRKRIYFDEDGTKKILIIRRLRCVKCKKIHHELPDFLVPYKRYCVKVVQQCVDTSYNTRPRNTKAPVDRPCCELSTIHRNVAWFKRREALFLATLHAVRALHPVPGRDPMPTFESIRLQCDWLACIVRELVNSGRWPQPDARSLSP